MERDKSENANFLEELENISLDKSRKHEIDLEEISSKFEAIFAPDDLLNRPLVISTISTSNKTEELNIITIEELTESKFSPGEIFWVKTNGKTVKVLNPGMIIDEEQRNKLTRYKDLKVKWSSNKEYITNGKIRLLGLKDSLDEIQRIEQRKIILSWLKDSFWSDGTNGNLLDLVFLGEQVFYKFDEDLTNRLIGTGQVLFERSALISTISTMIALIMGYTDYKFLEDIYHLCFLLDFTFDKGQYSFNINKASELERKTPGDGVIFLIVGEDTGPELDIFLHHAYKSAKEVRKNCSKYFNDPDIIKLLLRHHERLDGKGFPRGVNEAEVSDIERIIILTNNLISYSEQSYSLNDGNSFFKKLVYDTEKMDINSSLSNRLKDAIIKTMQNIDSAAINYKMGLGA